MPLVCSSLFVNVWMLNDLQLQINSGEWLVAAASVNDIEFIQLFISWHDLAFVQRFSADVTWRGLEWLQVPRQAFIAAVGAAGSWPCSRCSCCPGSCCRA